MVSKIMPRGVRNNNPGNIRKDKANKWQGLSDAQMDKNFCSFKDPVYGIRALCRLLIIYQDRYDCNTVMEFISKWAPPNENDTKAYALAIAHRIGCAVDSHVDMHNYDHLRPMVEGIITHENGASWQTWYDNAQLDKSLLMAGVEPSKKPLQQTRTIKGAQLATTGISLASAAEVVDNVKTQVEPLVPYAETMKFVFLGIALIGVLITIWARIDDRRKGLR